MTISGSKKRSGDSMGYREPKTSSVNVKEAAEPSKHEYGHLPATLNPVEMLSQYQNASLEFGSGTKPIKLIPEDEDGSLGAYRLSRELDHFIAKGLDALFADAHSSASKTPEESVADLQLQTARKLRQLLPTNKELLHLVQERNWIPLLLGWLNLHDRPAVQVEALLALTNIAELCAQQSYYGSSSTSATATAAAQAAVASASQVAGTTASSPSGSVTSSVSPFHSVPAGESSVGSLAPAAYPFPTLGPPNPGSVPFPPLSFSQTLSPEALAAFDASLSSTLQKSKDSANCATPGSLSCVPSSLALGGNAFPSTHPVSPCGTSSSNGAFLPPPTPIATQDVETSAFPQQLSASSQHLLLRHADAIPTLISLLSSPNKEVYEQAMWILGSIAAGDSTGANSSSNNSSSGSETGRDKSVAARDVILSAGVMKQLLCCLESNPRNLSLQRIGSWTLSNLVEGIFQQPSHAKSGSKSSEYSSSDEIEMQILLPVLRRLLQMPDAEVLSYTCWTLSHLCDGPSSHISAVVTSRDQNSPRGGLVPRLVELLGHSSWRVTKPALRTIGNIVCAECSEDTHQIPSTPTDYTEVILDCRAVPKLKELITHNNREIQKEACWTLSNIAAGTVDQIQAVIDSGAIAPLVKLVSNKGTDQEVRSEACWVVLNATSCGNDSQIEVLVDEGCVSVLGVLLAEASMVMMALEGLERVLQVEEAREATKSDADESTPILVSASLIEKAIDKHDSSAVNKRATRIWKQHFVSCALCRKSFSKHRTKDATFCEECKCYVCSNCDCQIYHLSYQEELWAATEEQTEAKKNAKKSRKAKKKEKQKQKKAKQHEPQDQPDDGSHADPPSPSCTTGRAFLHRSITSSNDCYEENHMIMRQARSLRCVPNIADDEERNGKSRDGQSPVSSDVDDEDADTNEDQIGEQQQPPVDFVQYLQQTGSVIALAKLMDAVEYGESLEVDEFVDAEIQMLGQHRTLNDPASN